MAGSLFTDALSGGVRVGGTLADLFQQRQDRRQLGELAKLIGAGDYQQGGAGLIGLGQVGAGIDVMQMPLKQRIAENKLKGGGVTYGKSPVYVRRPDGSLGIGVLGDDGNFKPIEGVNPAENLTKIDTGTGTALYGGKSGQQVGGEITMDNRTPVIDKETAKADVEFLQSAPQEIVNADQTLSNIQGVLMHPGLESATGAVQGKLPSYLANPFNMQAIEDFRARAEQLQGTAFLQAYQSLKGGGQITEIEGKKAEAAQARLNQAQSEPEYRLALEEMASLIRQRKARIETRMSELQGQAAETQNRTNAGLTKQQYDALPSGSVFEHNGKKYRKP